MLHKSGESSIGGLSVGENQAVKIPSMNFPSVKFPRLIFYPNAILLENLLEKNEHVRFSFPAMFSSWLGIWLCCDSFGPMGLDLVFLRNEFYLRYFSS